MLLIVARPWRDWPRHAPLLPLAGLGVAMAGTILLFYLAIQRLPLGIAIALQFLGPLAVAVLGSRQRIDLLWALLAGSGVWFLIEVPSGQGALDPIGALYALGAAAGWASYILIGGIAGRAFGRSTAALSVSIAALLILPVGLDRAGNSLIDPELLPLALAVALLSTAVPFSLELYALPRLPARSFAVFTSLEPAFAVISGFVILDELLAWTQLAGVGMVMVAAAGAAWCAAKASAV